MTVWFTRKIYKLYLAFIGVLALSGVVTIPGDIYAWTVVFLLPVNSALNPILYTISSLKAQVNKSRPMYI